MGTILFDTFSILHIGVGIVAYYWGINLKTWIIINIIYEIFENSIFGLHLLGKIKICPGEKRFSDNIINSVSDIFFSTIGWILSAYLDSLITNTKFTLNSKKNNIVTNVYTVLS